MDAVLTLCLLAGLHQELNHLLPVAYISVKEAFDSIDSSVLWLVLKGVGVPEVLLNLVCLLDTNISVRVHAGFYVFLHLTIFC